VRQVAVGRVAVTAAETLWPPSYGCHLQELLVERPVRHYEWAWVRRAAAMTTETWWHHSYGCHLQEPPEERPVRH
jgi:hypothetical protein